jgi:hypothetical protein
VSLFETGTTTSFQGEEKMLKYALLCCFLFACGGSESDEMDGSDSSPELKSGTYKATDAEVDDDCFDSSESDINGTTLKIDVDDDEIECEAENDLEFKLEIDDDELEGDHEESIDLEEEEGIDCVEKRSYSWRGEIKDDSTFELTETLKISAESGEDCYDPCEAKFTVTYELDD